MTGAWHADAVHINELNINTESVRILKYNIRYLYRRPEHRSLRAYLSVLYSAPRMKIYINNRKVRTQLLHASLFRTRYYTSSTTEVKALLKKSEKLCDADYEIGM